jgi:hypothetical protein
MQDGSAKKHVLVAAPRNILILVGFAMVAVIIFVTPLQRLIPLSRFQHYGIAIFVFGLGYLVQGVVSWPGIKGLARFGYLATTAFFCSAGLLFLNNPWLDLRMVTSGDEQLIFRNYVIGTYGAAGLFISLIWLLLAFQEIQLHYSRSKSSKPESES